MVKGRPESEIFGHFESVIMIHIIHMLYPSARLAVFCIKHAWFINHVMP